MANHEFKLCKPQPNRALKKKKTGTCNSKTKVISKAVNIGAPG